GPLDGVLAGLVAGDAASGVEVGAAARGAEHVEVLADVELDLQLVPHPAGVGRRAVEHPVGVHAGQVADQDGDALAEPTAFAPPPAAGVLGGELDVDGRGASPGVGAVHHVVVHQG